MELNYIAKEYIVSKNRWYSGGYMYKREYNENGFLSVYRFKLDSKNNPIKNTKEFVCDWADERGF